MIKSFREKRKALILLLLFSCLITIAIAFIANKKADKEGVRYKNGDEVLAVFNDQYDRFETVTDLLYGRYDVFNQIMDESGSARICIENIELLDNFLTSDNKLVVERLFSEAGLAQIYHGSGFVLYEFAVEKGRNPFMIFFIGGTSKNINETIYYLGQIFELVHIDKSGGNWYCSFLNVEEPFS